VEVRHDGETDSDTNHSPEFNAIIRRNTGEHMIRDFLIICDDSAASGKDD